MLRSKAREQVPTARNQKPRVPGFFPLYGRGCTPSSTRRSRAGQQDFRIPARLVHEAPGGRQHKRLPPRGRTTRLPCRDWMTQPLMGVRCVGKAVSLLAGVLAAFAGRLILMVASCSDQPPKADWCEHCFPWRQGTPPVTAAPRDGYRRALGAAEVQSGCRLAETEARAPAAR